MTRVYILGLIGSVLGVVSYHIFNPKARKPGYIDLLLILFWPSIPFVWAYLWLKR